ncbi:hypothetical protein ACX27_13435 [Nostoc piscinale CENA21]|uniref:Transmembrane protein n=1 Tax=Nostoc piscinale CENA21 TaxID=224013 RepID=A0A0M3V5B3_9NOSO|nr:hypothetical protein [Nostoc piscinale]ALF53613.1 hypothetical protein ACX27_13435 [Nostoc piscinale CENA21]
MRLDKLISIVSIIICLYIFFAFLTLPSGVRIGLDPSWQYAISRAALNKLYFGKDIIFTYGPLGYLIQGAVIEKNFYPILIFRLTVELITFCVSIATIKIQKNNLNKFILSTSIFLAYLLGLFIDYKIIFALIMVLSWDNVINNKNIRIWALGLGLLSGLCLLIKFNMGVCILGITILILLSEVWKSFKAQSHISQSLCAFLDFIIAALTTSFLLLNPNLADNFRLVILCVFFAILLGIILWAIKTKILEKTSNFNISISNNAIYKKINFKNTFYLIYTFAIFITSFYTSPHLLNYLRGSLEISSGYSSAMSIVGSPWEVGFAIVGILIVLLVLIQLIRQSQKYLGLSLALAITLWMSFKHGYVRQDGHVYIFIESLLIISSISITKLNNKFKFFKNITLVYLGIIISIYCFASSPLVNSNANVGLKLFQYFKPINIINKVVALTKTENLRHNINTNSSLELAKVKLPEQILKLLNNQTVDILPWEISLAESNNLKWHPRPIFQSYAAYTKFLDKANFHSISSQPPIYIIYGFNAIDNRHPFFDEPSTFSYIVCNYKLSSKFNEVIKLHTSEVSNMFLLEKLGKNICLSSMEGEELTRKWNESTNISDSSHLVRASVKFNYSFLGKIYKTIFRAPPVKIDILFKNSSSHSFRIIPENSENGIIISHLPLNDIQALSFFKGKWNQRVRSFKFSAVNPFLYKQDIQIKLDTYQVDPSIQIRDKSLDITNLKGIKFLQEPTEEYIGSLDSPEVSFEKGEEIYLHGWTVSKVNPQQPVSILVTYSDANIPLAMTKTSWDRYDVGEFYKNPNYNQSGWSISLDSDNLPKDTPIIKIWIYDPVNKTARRFKEQQDLKLNYIQ